MRTADSRRRTTNLGRYHHAGHKHNWYDVYLQYRYFSLLKIGINMPANKEGFYVSFSKDHPHSTRYDV